MAILTMKSSTVSLEEIFLELTSGEQEDEEEDNDDSDL